MLQREKRAYAEINFIANHRSFPLRFICPNHRFTVTLDLFN